MRILILHSRYLSGDASGENRVVRDESRLLSDAGHEVHTWEPSPPKEGITALARTAANAIWSRRAASRVSEEIGRSGIEIVHCHNLFPTLSPAVLGAAASSGAAVLMTLHNYRLMCLPSTFLRGGEICEDCQGRTPWPGVIHRCYRDSALGSATLAGSITLHRAIGSYERTTLYLAVSKFVRDKHVEAGFPPGRIAIKSNFAWPSARREGPGRYFLFLGRLSAEKGVDTLLEAWKGQSERLVVVGDGPDAARLRESAPPGVEFAGQVDGSEVPGLIRGARAVLLPSVWYEAQPRVILESFACGVPVLASQIGGLADDVTDGVSGRILAPHEPEAWRDAVHSLTHDDESLRLGDGAFEAWSERYTPTRAVEELERAYRRALAMR